MTAHSAILSRIHTHNIPTVNPCLPFQIPTHTTIKVAFIYYQSNSNPPTYCTTKNTTHTTKRTLWFQGTVDHPLPQKTTVAFHDMSTILTPNRQFRFLTLPTYQDISKSTKPLSLPDMTNFPFPLTSTQTTQKFIQFTLKNNLSSPKFQHLHYWGCHDLLAALDAYPNATVAYTDRSDDPTVDTPTGAAISFHITPPTTICNILPIKGSYPAEPYAIILFTYLPQMNTFSVPIVFAIDNLSFCSTLHQIQQLNAKPFASNANCFALWYNYIWNFLHNTQLHIIFTWIKGHADFVGNEHSERMCKWVSLNLPQHPENHNPDTSHFIYHNHTPVPGRITRKTVKHLLTRYKHNNIHLPSLTDFCAHTSWFSRIPFKWTNGLYCCTGFLPHYKLNTYHCPNSHTHHLLDPITTVTECKTAKPIRDLFFEVWQQLFKQTVTNWWQHATKGERRNYIRTLNFNSLSNALRHIPPNTPYFQHQQNLKAAFKYRRKRLQTALQETQTWLRLNPINDLHLLQLDSADSPWDNQYFIYSTSSHNPALLTYPKRTNTTVANKHPHKHRHVVISMVSIDSGFHGYHP